MRRIRLIFREMLEPPKKILAMKLRALGDTVLMTAPLAELRRLFPSAEIHAAVSEAWTPVLERHPAVDRVWGFQRRSERAARAKALARFGFALRREGFDWVLCFHASPTSATLAFATGAQVRSIHFHGPGDRNRFSTVEVPGKGRIKPITERDMDTIRALGVHVPAGRLPEIPVLESERRQADEWLARTHLPTPLLVLGLGASRPAKIWPLERFAALTVEWVERRKGGVLAIAGPEEAELTAEFLKEVDALLGAVMADPSRRAVARTRVSADHRLSIRSLISLLARSAVFVGNDSGPRHLAAAVGTPTVTLFGPEHPFEWHPYPPDRHPYAFVESLPCRKDAAPGMPPWCAVGNCVEERHRCMRLIGVDAVMAHCEALTAQRKDSRARGASS